MRMYDLIYKKRQGRQLTPEEIAYLVQGYLLDEIPDYQVSALLMAIYFQGMGLEETKALTEIMAESGDEICLSSIPGRVVDKHSTGGVGDTTTLVLVPLVSAAGIPVAKMSGRSLGHGGGTIDKLESIPGFVTDLSREAFLAQVHEIGAAVISQTGNLSPADKKLYALRDVTATVDSIPLIASSIMSKKIAGGAEGIVLDVKVGGGAFMKGQKEAISLAQVMVDLGKALKRRMVALITNMEQPLGSAVGNALEVKEAVATLRGEGPFDLLSLSLSLGAHMLFLAGENTSFDHCYGRLKKRLDAGYGLEQLEKIITAQGGDPRIIEDPDRLPAAKYTLSLKSEKNGFLTHIDAYRLGSLVMDLGAGRVIQSVPIDYGVGVVLKKKVGDAVSKGEELMVIHYNDRSKEDLWRQCFKGVFTIGEEKGEELPLIIEQLG